MTGPTRAYVGVCGGIRRQGFLPGCREASHTNAAESHFGGGPFSRARLSGIPEPLRCVRGYSRSSVAAGIFLWVFILAHPSSSGKSACPSHQIALGHGVDALAADDNGAGHPGEAGL